MTRRELVLNKLQNLSDDEVAEALRQLTHHVKARLRFRSKADRTKSGAHGEKNLGMNAIDYYVGECVKRLYEPNGWDWKFEKFTFAQQLMRIANKLISDKVTDFKEKKEELPIFDEKDANDIDNLHQIANIDVRGNEEMYARLILLAQEKSKDDENLEYFTLRYFEDASYETIAEEMGLTVNQVYVLRKKLVRRLSDYKEELTA